MTKVQDTEAGMASPPARCLDGVPPHMWVTLP